MKIGIFSEPFNSTLEDIREEAALAQQSHASTLWLAQIWRYDALTLIPALAQIAPDVEFASGVVASYLRHPMTLASQALTVNLLTKGKFTLGVGLMHKPLIEGMFEMSFDKPARHMKEYLDILLPLLDQSAVDASGASVSYHGEMQVPGAPTCEVMLAALGPKMLKLCGERTRGTITWMTGASTIRDYIRPSILSAAEDAKRPEPRIAALLPVMVTDDAKAGRAVAAEQFEIYGRMPSYRAMLDKSGTANPEDHVLIGNEDEVAAELRSYAAAGVTDCGLLLAGTREHKARGFEFVRSLGGFYS